MQKKTAAPKKSLKSPARDLSPLVERAGKVKAGRGKTIRTRK